jgi:hypothetical protein
MALSNIFREPRREITETGVGVLIFLPVAWLDYTIAARLHSLPAHTDEPFIVPVIIAFFIILLGAIALLVLALGIHAVGEDICNSLEARGVHLRPRRRFTGG